MATLAIEEGSFLAPEKIQNSVTRFLESKLRHQYENFKIDILPMDPRLKLNQCKSPLRIFSPPGQSQIGPLSVGIRCAEPKPWLIYMRANVSILESVVVAKKFLKKATLIKSTDIELKEMDLSKIHHNFFLETKDVIGKELKRSIAAGNILRAQNLIIPKAVKRGEQVIIIAKNKGMQIRMNGTALSDGILGQKVAVRNASSNRVVQGTVTSPGIIQVQF